MTLPLRLLTFTTLYPNAAQPHHGVFVENRLRHLLEHDHGITARVVAPVPWFPFSHPRFGGYAAFARAPAAETRHGIAVEHPRYPVIPKVGMTAAPYLLYRAARPVLERLRADGYRFDMIDAHYFYPDGVAAALLARHFGVPLSITARGTDINLIPRYPRPRRMIRWAAGQADALVTVCEALKDGLVDLGVPAGRVTTLRNGVDLTMFRPPADRAALRRDLGLPPAGAAPVLASVGHLIERKRHHLAIEALPHLPPETRLLIAGEGPEEGALKRRAEVLGVAGRVRFLGRLPHDRLHEVYGACDALVLASSREGWANVLLEAMACGTPVAASRIWGTPEVVAAPEAGRLFDDPTGAAVARAVAALLADPPDRAATRAYAERFGWDDTSRGQARLFRAAVGAPAAA
ncbi:glycosyltransferase family 4 protein [Caenispirillum salinarum]|uniref:glycosyltransferase family 4 protein n=1 Tax=Caenispirillum salinarum TaxID=859058 RepID=UPI00384E53C7